MKKIPVWFDTDIGVDDSIALCLGSSFDKIEFVGVSAVAGNVPLTDTYRNARDVLSLLGREDVKVYAGADKPLVKELYVAEYFHGKNGLGGAELAPSKAKHEEKHAIDAMYEKAVELNGEMVLVAVGPLTNVALALRKYPDFKKLIKELIIMGGGAREGNITPYAEFNIYVDPHAAKEVFDSGLKIRMFGLDVTLEAHLTFDECAEIGTYDNKIAQLFKNSTGVSLNHKRKMQKFTLAMHDPTTLLYLQYPDLFKGVEAKVWVETEDEERIGQTVCDFTAFEKNTYVMDEVKRDEMAKIILDTYKNFK